MYLVMPENFANSRSSSLNFDLLFLNGRMRDSKNNCQYEGCYNKAASKTGTFCLSRQFIIQIAESSFDGKGPGGQSCKLSSWDEMT
jgi:hypothetical protein